MKGRTGSWIFGHCSILRDDRHLWSKPLQPQLGVHSQTRPTCLWVVHSLCAVLTAGLPQSLLLLVWILALASQGRAYQTLFAPFWCGGNLSGCRERHGRVVMKHTGFETQKSVWCVMLNYLVCVLSGNIVLFRFWHKANFTLNGSMGYLQRFEQWGDKGWWGMQTRTGWGIPCQKEERVLLDPSETWNPRSGI